MGSDDQNPRPQPGEGGDARPPNRMNRGAFGWVLIVGLTLMLIMMFRGGAESAQVVSISEFETRLRNGQVKAVELRDDETVIAELTVKSAGANTDKIKVNVPQDLMNSKEFMEKIEASKNPVEVTYKKTNNVLFTVFINTLPWLLMFGIIWFFLFRQLRQAGGGPGMLSNFGRSRHRMMTKEHTSVTFNDVAGIDEAKDEVSEIVEFLRNPKRFQRLGGRIPRGVLLVGEPGCGKTLLAKAIAGEAEVPFFSISGSDFVEMFVGVGASRVRDLFRQAKENSPCIVFLDEIDAVGRRRGVGYTGGGHDEREQTLNAILVEMDGFDSNDQVIVIAATNRADVLDPALVRPGRFDRQVFVPLPDVKGRYDILKVHAKKIKIKTPIEAKLQRLARATPMFSGADLAAVINEAALIAALSNQDWVDMEDLEEARDKIRFGRAKRSRVVEEKERKLTAYHEAGHAIVQSLLKEADPVHKVSIIPRGPYGGVTFSLPEKDRMTYSRGYLLATLRTLCAGRIAEEMIGEDYNSGAAGDIKQATQIAEHMVKEWGMSERLGFMFYGEDDKQQVLIPGKEFSNATVELIDGEKKKLIDAAYADSRAMLVEHRTALENVAQALLKYETLTGEEVRQIMAGQTLDRPTVADLIAAEQARRASAPPPVARPVERPTDGPDGPLPHPA